ncbi:hypothetical protein BCR35DRAFT_300039 [Leucosporidium creatinivorum]|uniref:Uncharacterized protein n=1 Tax=Leucosporidium creatinivorum TaxID=106004 RepID=A0A1Y2G219_9BASI|nr:hypothetical protein BCR35DRAFT_300039 [Leucosporidium creatinivorum]
MIYYSFSPAPISVARPQHSSDESNRRSEPKSDQQPLSPFAPLTPLRPSPSSSASSPTSSASDESSASTRSTPATTPERSPEQQQKAFGNRNLFESLGAGGQRAAGVGGPYVRKPRPNNLLKKSYKPSIPALSQSQSQLSYNSNSNTNKKVEACACVEGWIAKQEQQEGEREKEGLLPSVVFKCDKAVQTMKDLLPVASKQGSTITELGDQVDVFSSPKSSQPTTPSPSPRKPATAIASPSPSPIAPASARTSPLPKTKTQRTTSRPATPTPAPEPSALLPARTEPPAPPSTPTSSSSSGKRHKRTPTPPHHPYASAVESRKSRPTSPTTNISAERRKDESQKKKERPIEVVREALAAMICSDEGEEKKDLEPTPTPTPASSPLINTEQASTEVEPLLVPSPPSAVLDEQAHTPSTSNESTSTPMPTSTAPVDTPAAPLPTTANANSNIAEPEQVEPLSTPCEPLHLLPTPIPAIQYTPPSPEITAPAAAQPQPAIELQAQPSPSVIVVEEETGGVAEMEDIEIDEPTPLPYTITPTAVPTLDYTLPPLSAEQQLLVDLALLANPTTNGAQHFNQFNHFNGSNYGFPTPQQQQHDNSLAAIAAEFGFPPSSASSFAVPELNPLAFGFQPTFNNFQQQPTTTTTTFQQPTAHPSFEEYASLMSATLPSLPALPQQQQQQLLTAPASALPPSSSFANIFTNPNPNPNSSAAAAVEASTEMSMDAVEEGREIQKLVEEVLEAMEREKQEVGVEGKKKQQAVEPEEKQVETSAEVEMENEDAHELTEDFVAQKRRSLSIRLVNGRYFPWNGQEYERFDSRWTLRSLPSHQHVSVNVKGRFCFLYNVPDEHGKMMKDIRVDEEKKEKFWYWFCEMEQASLKGETVEPFDWEKEECARADLFPRSSYSTNTTTTSSSSSYIYLQNQPDSNTVNTDSWRIEYRASRTSKPNWLLSIPKEETHKIVNGDMALLEELVKKQEEKVARMAGLVGPPPFVGLGGAIPTFGSQPVVNPSMNFKKLATTTTATPAAKAASAFAYNPFGALPKPSSSSSASKPAFPAPPSSTTKSDPTTLMFGPQNPLTTTTKATKSSKGKAKAPVKAVASSSAAASSSNTTTKTLLGLGDRAPRPSARNQQIAASAHYTSSDDDDDMQVAAALIAPKEDRRRPVRAMPGRRPKSRV